MEGRGLGTQIQRDSTRMQLLLMQQQFCILIVALQESTLMIKLHSATHTLAHTRERRLLHGDNKIRSVV